MVEGQQVSQCGWISISKKERWEIKSEISVSQNGHGGGYREAWMQGRDWPGPVTHPPMNSPLTKQLCTAAPHLELGLTSFQLEELEPLILLFLNYGNQCFLH